MSRKVRTTFLKLIGVSAVFTLGIISRPVCAQVSGPIDYSTASQNLAELFIISASHQAVRPTDDFGKFWGTYTESESWRESYSTEYGLSLQILPLNQTIKNSFLTFDVPSDRIPQNLYVPRFHYMVGLQRNLAAGLSFLYYPDWQMLGVGLTGEYTFFHLENFYTGLLLNYGGAWKSDFMNLTSGGAALVQTYAVKGFEVFAGMKYSFGTADFIPPANQQNFGTINYENQFGTSYLAGVSFNIFRHLGVWDETLTFTGQVDFEKNLDPNYIGKLTLKVPSHRSYSQPLGVVK